jgi:uncharacterized cupredoxin-like copper-binding protein
MMKNSTGLMALALMAAIGLAGCSSGATPAAGGTGGDGATGGTELTVKTLDTFAYDPNAWTVPASQDVSLTLDNSAGALEHSFIILNEGVTAADAVNITPDGDADKKYYSLVVPMGSTESGTFTAPATPGDYVVVCAVAGHAAGGMLGTLTVQ